MRVKRGVTIAAGTTVWKDVEEDALVLNDKTQTSKTGYVRPTKKKELMGMTRARDARSLKPSTD